MKTHVPRGGGGCWKYKETQKDVYNYDLYFQGLSEENVASAESALPAKISRVAGVLVFLTG